MARPRALPSRVVSFRFPEDDLSRWEAQARRRGITLKEHVKLLLDGGQGEVTGPDDDAVVCIAATAREEGQCAVSGCDYDRVTPFAVCARHRHMEGSPFLGA